MHNFDQNLSTRDLFLDKHTSPRCTLDEYVTYDLPQSLTRDQKSPIEKRNPRCTLMNMHPSDFYGGGYFSQQLSRKACKVQSNDYVSFLLFALLHNFYHTCYCWVSFHIYIPTKNGKSIHQLGALFSLF